MMKIFSIISISLITRTEERKEPRKLVVPILITVGLLNDNCVLNYQANYVCIFIKTIVTTV